MKKKSIKQFQESVKKYYPTCSVWVGRFPNTKPKYETDEWEDKDGKTHKSRYRIDKDINIETDGFPNHGVVSALDALKQGHDIDNIKWENSGGGASIDMLDRQFDVARIIHENELDLTNEEVGVIDIVTYDDDMITPENKEKVEELVKKIPIEKMLNVIGKFGKLNKNIYKVVVTSKTIPTDIKKKILDRVVLESI